MCVCLSHCVDSFWEKGQIRFAQPLAARSIWPECMQLAVTRPHARTNRITTDVYHYHHNTTYRRHGQIQQTESLFGALFNVIVVVGCFAAGFLVTFLPPPLLHTRTHTGRQTLRLAKNTRPEPDVRQRDESSRELSLRSAFSCF